MTFEGILIKVKIDQVFLQCAVSIDSIDCANTSPGAKFFLRILKDARSMKRDAESGSEVRAQPALQRLSAALGIKGKGAYAPGVGSINLL